MYKIDFVKISVIMPSFNQATFLEEAMQSVFNQSYPNLEFIVLDAGSTDGSVDIIKKYADKITYWRSHPDGGQSAAFNEGFRMATGDFLTWLNSDDVMLPGTLHLLNEYVHKYPSYDWFMGNTVWMDKDGKIFRVGKMEKWSDFFTRRGLYSAGGPTAFFRKSLLERYGYLREDFHYSMDMELWDRFIENGVKFKRIKDYCWALRMHDMAKTSSYMFVNKDNAESVSLKQKERKEETKMHKNLYPMFVHGRCYHVLFSIYKICGITAFSRIWDRRYIGKHYKSIKR